MIIHEIVISYGASNSVGLFSNAYPYNCISLHHVDDYEYQLHKSGVPARMDSGLLTGHHMREAICWRAIHWMPLPAAPKQK